MKTFTAPEGKLVTVLVDGVEVSYVPGQEYPDNAEFVVTEPMTEQPASFDKRGIEPYRAAIMVNEGGVDEKNSVKGAIVGGTVTGERTSAVDMTPLFVPFANKMCTCYDQTTAGGFRIDKTWAPNDGLVNTVSALYPTDSAGRCLTKTGQTGYVQRDGYSNVSYQPGVWNVMPVRHYDHGNFIAGMPVPDLASQSVTALRQFYLSLMDNLSHVRAVSGLPFTDVAADRWSYSYIKKMYDAGAVSGTSATTFSPDANVTRAQFVTMLAGLAKADVSKYPATPFRDVPESAWYAPYVNWALANGIVSGTSATTFSPDAGITRQDLAVMRYRYTQRYSIALQQQTVAPFTDEGSIADYALPAVQALHRAGAISGMPAGSFRPYSNATREQACVMLCAL